MHLKLYAYVDICININLYIKPHTLDTYMHIYKLLNIYKFPNPMHYRKFISAGDGEIKTILGTQTLEKSILQFKWG